MLKNSGSHSPKPAIILCETLCLGVFVAKLVAVVGVVCKQARRFTNNPTRFDHQNSTNIHSGRHRQKSRTIRHNEPKISIADLAYSKIVHSNICIRRDNCTVPRKPDCNECNQAFDELLGRSIAVCLANYVPKSDIFYPWHELTIYREMAIFP